MNAELDALAELGDEISKHHEATQAQIAKQQERIEALEAGEAASGTIAHGAADAERKMVESWMRGDGRGDLKPGEVKSLSLSSGSDILAPETIASEIEKYAKGSSALVARAKNSQSSTADYHRIARVDVPTASWSAESGSRSTSTDILYRDRQPTHGELYYVWRVSNWLLNDSQFDLASEFLQEAGAGFGRALESAMLSGTGSSQPTGLLNTAPSAVADYNSPLRVADSIEKIARPSPDNLTDHLIVTLLGLNAAYRQNAVWTMNSSTLAVVRRLKDSENRPLFQDNYAAGIDAGDGLLLGKPVIVAESMPDFGQSPEQASILVGDFDRGYELVRIGGGSGLTLVVDQVTSKGHTLYYVAARYGGTLLCNDAVKAIVR